MSVHHIDAGLIEQLVTMEEAIDNARQAFIAFSASRTQTPQRSVMRTAGGVSICMPGFVEGCATLSVKIVSVHDENRRRKLPTVQSILLLTCVRTGKPLALIDGARLTSLRTAAASAVATDALANAAAKSLAVIGAGALALDHVAAIRSVRELEEIRLFSAGGRSARALCAVLRRLYPALAIRVARTAHDAVCGADIVSCITNSSVPVFEATSIAPGTHINGIGSYTTAMTEVPLEGLRGLRIAVDSLASVLLEAGDIAGPLRAGLIDVGDVHEIGAVLGGGEALRRAEEEITFFKAVGIAAQDAALADLVYARHQQWRSAQENRSN